MGFKGRSGDLSEVRKRKRDGITEFDVGIEANECIKLFLVSKPEEMDAASGFCINPVDLNQFFGDDGKIYGYKNLKINIWLSSRSFHAYLDISFEKSFNGAMGITDLNPVFQILFGESLVVKKDEFLCTFSAYHHYIRDVILEGAVIDVKVLGGTGSKLERVLETDAAIVEHQVIQMDPSKGPVGQLYSRLVPLVLLLVEGGRPIDISDPRWDIFCIIEKRSSHLGAVDIDLIGFATMYRFYHYPDSTRIRISQLLVLPPYQGHGHGGHILETINSVAITERVYDVTAEEPSDQLQHIRACIDIHRLLSFEPVRQSVSCTVARLKEIRPSQMALPLKCHWAPPASMIEDVREKLKINKKQFLRCWDVLLFLHIDPSEKKAMANFRACISDQLEAEVIEREAGRSGRNVVDVSNEYNSQMTFVVFQTEPDRKVDGAEATNGRFTKDQEVQLSQVVDKRMEEISEVASKTTKL